MRPQWDNTTRTLYLGTTLVRQYRVPAENQVVVLEAFERAGWPQRIDDPLPERFGTPRKMLLNETVRSLNRSQKLIKFRGDGTGTGILWEPR